MLPGCLTVAVYGSHPDTVILVLQCICVFCLYMFVKVVVSCVNTIWFDVSSTSSVVGEKIVSIE